MDEKRFIGEIIILNIASGKIELKFQVSISAPDPIKSKMEYEKAYIGHSLMVKKLYRADNDTLTAQSMLIEEYDQSLSFCGADPLPRSPLHCLCRPVSFSFG